MLGIGGLALRKMNTGADFALALLLAALVFAQDFAKGFEAYERG
jgi:hypothetical protein